AKGFVTAKGFARERVRRSRERSPSLPRKKLVAPAKEARRSREGGSPVPLSQRDECVTHQGAGDVGANPRPTRTCAATRAPSPPTCWTATSRRPNRDGRGTSPRAPEPPRPGTPGR